MTSHQCGPPSSPHVVRVQFQFGQIPDPNATVVSIGQTEQNLRVLVVHPRGTVQLPSELASCQAIDGMIVQSQACSLQLNPREHVYLFGAPL